MLIAGSCSESSVKASTVWAQEQLKPAFALAFTLEGRGRLYQLAWII